MLGRDAQLGPKDLNSPNSPNGLNGPKQPKQPKQLKWPWASRRLGARTKQRKNQTRIFEMQNLSFAPYPILSGPRRKKTIPSESSLHRAGESGPRSERRSWSLEEQEHEEGDQLLSEKGCPFSAFSALKADRGKRKWQLSAEASRRSLSHGERRGEAAS